VSVEPSDRQRALRYALQKTRLFPAPLGPVLRLWYEGLDTVDIAKRLQVTEAAVWNALALGDKR